MTPFTLSGTSPSRHVGEVNFSRSFVIGRRGWVITKSRTRGVRYQPLLLHGSGVTSRSRSGVLVQTVVRPLGLAPRVLPIKSPKMRRPDTVLNFAELVFPTAPCPARDVRFRVGLAVGAIPSVWCGGDEY